MEVGVGLKGEAPSDVPGVISHDPALRTTKVPLTPDEIVQGAACAALPAPSRARASAMGRRREQRREDEDAEAARRLG